MNHPGYDYYWLRCGRCGDTYCAESADDPHACWSAAAAETLNCITPEDIDDTRPDDTHHHGPSQAVAEPGSLGSGVATIASLIVAELTRRMLWRAGMRIALHGRKWRLCYPWSGNQWKVATDKGVWDVVPMSSDVLLDLSDWATLGVLIGDIVATTGGGVGLDSDGEYITAECTGSFDAVTERTEGEAVGALWLAVTTR